MEKKVIRDIASIDADIAATKEALKNVHGTETEVYARIVGYYRAVRNWNKGKRDEFDHRKMFIYHDPVNYVSTTPDTAAPTLFTKDDPDKNEMIQTEDNEVHYDLFIRKTCPNCPPVKEYMAQSHLKGTLIDVDTAEGLALAAQKGVFAAPTVIMYAENGTEFARCHTKEELAAVLEHSTVTAAL